MINVYIVTGRKLGRRELGELAATRGDRMEEARCGHKGHVDDLRDADAISTICIYTCSFEF